MRSSPLYRWLLAVGLLTLGSVCASENKAAASCGDYVHIASKAETATKGEAPTDAPCPCRGPACRNSPETPTPAPAPSTTTQNQAPDAIIMVPVEVVELATSPLTSVDFHAFHVPAESVFHPPR